MTEKSRSNYDRWRPGIKLACMMALKRVAADPGSYNAASNRFSAQAWHLVAEHLNKEYPDYAKRFTNINVKDRYDRVLKHHKVFKRMANRLSGFVWNPKTFCFELNDKTIKEYEENIRTDQVLTSELSAVRFLCKPGHIDLEYYHRYIYQFEGDINNDSVLNAPSFIEEAIEKGVLSNLSTKVDLFKKNSITSASSASSSATLSTLNSAVPSFLDGSTSSGSVPSLSSNSSLPTTSSLNNSIHSSTLVPQIQPPSLNMSHYSSIPPPQGFAVNHGLLQPPPNPNQQSHNSQQVPHLQHSPHIPHQHQHQQQLHHPHQNTQHGHHHQQHPQQQEQGQRPQQSQQQDEHHQRQQQQNASHNIHQPQGLMFSELLDNQQGIINNLSIGMTNTQENNDPNKNESIPRKRLKSEAIQTGLLIENYSQSLNNSPSQQNRRLSSGLSTHPTNSVVRTGIPMSYDGNESIGSSNNRTGGLSTGEAVLQLHKDFEAMESAVIEAVLNLRVKKLITHEDFEKINVILQDINGVFVRSAYKRLEEESKLLELINIYLDKLE